MSPWILPPVKWFSTKTNFQDQFQGRQQFAPKIPKPISSQLTSTWGRRAKIWIIDLKLLDLVDNSGELDVDAMVGHDD